MTEDQIEAIARAYCRKVGEDPDSLTITFAGDEETFNGPTWKFHSGQIKAVFAFTAIQAAIAEVIGAP